MANQSFTSLDALLKYVQKEATKTLQQSQSVKKVVVDKLVDSIEKNVYDAYTPSPTSPYVRQRDHGGLIDPENFEVDNIEDGVAIYSTREGTDFQGEDVYVAEIIEGYKEYTIPDKWGYGYETPRKFVQPAKDELDRSGEVGRVLKEEMKGKGFDIK